MKILKTLATISIVFAISLSNASQERDLGRATATTCEKLLSDASTQFGSLADIEYAISFSIEDRWIIQDLRRGNEKTDYLSEELRETNLRIARLTAMHYLFQVPTCPIASNWWSYKPKVLKLKDSLWE